MVRTIMAHPDAATALRELAAQVEQYPAVTQDGEAALAWVRERLMALAATVSAAERPAGPTGPHCARCRASVATELRRQIFMN